MTRPSHLLFMCTGNICRSPMAEVLAADYAAKRRRSVVCQSAGMLDLDGRRAERNAMAVVAELGLSLTDHASQPVTAELLTWADYVLVMEVRHASFLREHWPELSEQTQILLLGQMGGTMEIEDPIGSWKRRFRKSRDEILRCVTRFVDRLPPSPRGT